MSTLPGDGITVRLARADDAPELQARCLPMAVVGGVRGEIEENIAGFDRGRRAQLVAELEGAVAGMVILMRGEHILHTHRAELFSLVTAAEFHGRGVARRLVAEAQRIARSMGVEILEVRCRGGTPAEQVYRRLGFQEYGRLPCGLKEPCGDRQVFDEVSFFMAI